MHCIEICCHVKITSAGSQTVSKKSGPIVNISRCITSNQRNNGGLLSFLQNETIVSSTLPSFVECRQILFTSLRSNRLTKGIVNSVTNHEMIHEMIHEMMYDFSKRLPSVALGEKATSTIWQL